MNFSFRKLGNDDYKAKIPKKKKKSKKKKKLKRLSGIRKMKGGFKYDKAE